MVNFAFQPLYTRYPFNRRLGGPSSKTGRFGDEKNTSLHNFTSNARLGRCSAPVMNTTGFESQSEHPSIWGKGDVFTFFVCLCHTAESAFICAAVSALYLRKDHGLLFLPIVTATAFRVRFHNSRFRVNKFESTSEPSLTLLSRPFAPKGNIILLLLLLLLLLLYNYNNNLGEN
jgi:hypothetical protein